MSIRDIAESIFAHVLHEDSDPLEIVAACEAVRRVLEDLLPCEHCRELAHAHAVIVSDDMLAELNAPEDEAQTEHVVN